MRATDGAHLHDKLHEHFVLASLTLVVALLFAAFLVIHFRKTHVYDGFESDELDSRWSRHRVVPGSFRTQSEIVRAGHSAGEITVRSRDLREEASDDGNASERDELMESWWLFGHAGRAYRYTFSLYLPADFPSCRTFDVTSELSPDDFSRRSS